MKKSSLIVFVALMLSIIFLYNIFPLDDSKDNESSQVSGRIEEEDPMTGEKVITTIGTKNDITVSEPEENEVKTEVKTEDDEDKKDLEEQKKIDEEKKEEEQKRAEAEKKKREEEERKKAEKRKKEEEKNRPKSKNSKKIDKIIRIARSKLGKPFRQAGVTDEGYDCSGLIMTSYAKQNVKLPRASYEMVKKGTPVKLKDVRRGDLLFFATKPNQPKRVSHVGMVTKVENGKIYFIHSHEKVGVILNTLDEGYYKKRFLKAKRYLK